MKAMKIEEIIQALQQTVYDSLKNVSSEKLKLKIHLEDEVEDEDGNPLSLHLNLTAEWRADDEPETSSASSNTTFH
jgi:hypothetical protein